MLGAKQPVFRDSGRTPNLLQSVNPHARNINHITIRLLLRRTLRIHCKSEGQKGLPNFTGYGSLCRPHGLLLQKYQETTSAAKVVGIRTYGKRGFQELREIKSNYNVP